MKRDIINPWTWQEPLGFVHGNKVSGEHSTFYLAGQTASDEQGNCLHVGDMKGQIDRTLENIGKILTQGGMDFTNVVRLNIYTTDMKAILDAHDHMVEGLRSRGCRHTGCLLGVSALASPGALVEMEVTAVA
ncbi:MAG: RidA family protein [Pseudomonadota bacterium]|nr:RidA family protein [Pseudomonadota bacterium]